MSSDDIGSVLNEEALRSKTIHGKWHPEYLALSYRSAAALALAVVRGGRPRVLKTDLWNECLGGNRDIVHHLQETTGCTVVAVDVALSICAQGRALVPRAYVVQADIRALPFRSGSFDAVLDLSTLDHLQDSAVAEAIGEYRRVLRRAGVLLLVFWQRNALIRLRLFLKRLLGRREKPGQHYLARADVRAWLGDGLQVVIEFVAGVLLTPPQRLTGLVLGRLTSARLTRILRWLVGVEQFGTAHPVLKHLAGLYGIVVLRRDD